MEGEIQTYEYSRCGIIVRASYKPDWLNPSDEVACLEIRSINSDRVPLPITETGYKSHLIHRILKENQIDKSLYCHS